MTEPESEQHRSAALHALERAHAHTGEVPSDLGHVVASVGEAITHGLLAIAAAVRDRS
jgi:hypothetical protein